MRWKEPEFLTCVLPHEADVDRQLALFEQDHPFRLAVVHGIQRRALTRGEIMQTTRAVRLDLELLDFGWRMRHGGRRYITTTDWFDRNSHGRRDRGREARLKAGRTDLLRICDEEVPQGLVQLWYMGMNDFHEVLFEKRVKPGESSRVPGFSAHSPWGCAFNTSCPGQ